MQVQHDLFRTTALNHWDKMALLAIIDVGRSDMPNKWNSIDAETMSERTGIGKSTCYRSIKSLIDLGVLAVRPQYSRSNEYQIQWDALDALIEAASIVHTVESSVHAVERTVYDVEGSVHSVESSFHGVAPKKKSFSRSSKKNPLRGEQGSASPRPNELTGRCVVCGKRVRALSGKLIRNKPAHLDCDPAICDDDELPPTNWYED